MLNWRFWSNTIINQQNLEHYMNLQTDPLDNLLRTHPIQMGWEISIEVYLNWQFRGIDDPGCQFGDGSVPTETRTRSDDLEPLLTLALTNNSSSYSIHWPPSNYPSCSDVPSQSSLMTLPSDTEILYHYDHTILSNVVTPQPSSISWSIIFPPLHNMLTPSPYLPQSPPFRNINPCPLPLHIAQLSHWTISRKPGWSQYPHPRSEVLRELVPKIPASLDNADGIDPLPANHLQASLVLKLSCRNPSIRYGAVSDSNISDYSECSKSDTPLLHHLPGGWRQDLLPLNRIFHCQDLYRYSLYLVDTHCCGQVQLPGRLRYWANHVARFRLFPI